MSAEKETERAVGRCAFCGFTKDEREFLVACSASMVAICEHCIGYCVEIIAERMRVKSTQTHQGRANPSPPHASQLQGAEAPATTEN